MSNIYLLPDLLLSVFLPPPSLGDGLGGPFYKSSTICSAVSLLPMAIWRKS